MMMKMKPVYVCLSVILLQFLSYSSIGQSITANASTHPAPDRSLFFQVGADQEWSYFLQVGTSAMGAHVPPFEFIRANKNDHQFDVTNLILEEKKLTILPLFLKTVNSQTFVVRVKEKGQHRFLAKTYGTDFQLQNQQEIFVASGMSLVKESSKYEKSLGKLEPSVSHNLKNLAMGSRYKTILFQVGNEQVFQDDHPNEVNIKLFALDDGGCYAFRQVDGGFGVAVFGKENHDNSTMIIPTQAGDNLVSVTMDEQEQVYAVVMTGEGGLHCDNVPYSNTNGGVTLGVPIQNKTFEKGFRCYRLTPDTGWELLAENAFQEQAMEEFPSASKKGIQWLTVDQVACAGGHTYVVFQQRHRESKEVISSRSEGIIVVDVDEKSGQSKQLVIPRQCWVADAYKAYEKTYFKWHNDGPLLGYYTSNNFKNYQFTFHRLDQSGTSSKTSIALDQEGSADHHNINSHDWWFGESAVLTNSRGQGSFRLGWLKLP